MSLHAIATEFFGCWEHSPAVGLFVRIGAPNGEFTVRDARRGYYRIDWFPARGGCESAVLSYPDACAHLGRIAKRGRYKPRSLPGYEHSLLRLPTSRDVLESLLARVGLSLFGDCLVTADGWLFCEVTDLAATFTALWELAGLTPTPGTAEVVRRLQDANVGG